MDNKESFFCFLVHNLVFLQTLFLENEAQISKRELPNNVLHDKTSLSAKNKLNSARNEHRPKKQYTPFLHESLQ